MFLFSNLVGQFVLLYSEMLVFLNKGMEVTVKTTTADTINVP